MATPPPDSELHRLMTAFPRAGEVRWIGLRPARGAHPVAEGDEHVLVASHHNLVAPALL